MIHDLKPNTQYEFTVKLVKVRNVQLNVISTRGIRKHALYDRIYMQGKRSSPWSMIVLNQTQEAAPSTAPRDLTIQTVEDRPTSVLLRWQPPKQINGQITGSWYSWK